MNDMAFTESAVERRARLQAELIEREVEEKRAAFREFGEQYVDVQLREIIAEDVREIAKDLTAALPDLIATVRRCASAREGVLAARAWWRAFREKSADEAQDRIDRIVGEDREAAEALDRFDRIAGGGSR